MPLAPVTQSRKPARAHGMTTDGSAPRSAAAQCRGNNINEYSLGKCMSRRRNEKETGGKKVPGLTFPLVGLGASAGGVKALQTFFEGMPSDSGMAFVVVMHLSPDHASALAQVLQQRT